MKTRVFLAAMAMVMAPAVCFAVSETDVLRCEALQLRKQSRHQMCLARCDRRSTNSETFDAARCEESCNDGLQSALESIQSKRMCSDPPADPHRCEAKILKVEAQQLVCQSRCVVKGQRREDFDATGCLAACEEDAAAAHDETMSSPTCAAGRMADEP